MSAARVSIVSSNVATVDDPMGREALVCESGRVQS